MLGRYRPKPKCIYGIHDPIGLHYLFQLRTGLSPLKSHKRHHNFLDTPNDTCNCRQAAEDTNHFLFDCLLFAPHIDNKQILSSTIQYIKVEGFYWSWANFDSDF